MGTRSGNGIVDVGQSENSGPLARPFFPVVEHGVDWLTATCDSSTLRRAFYEKSHRLIYQEQEEGNDVSEWTFEQFKGLQAGQVAFGVSDSMAIVRLSSELARVHWKRFVELSTSVSRLDYQVTFRNVVDTPALIRECHEEARIFASDKKPMPEVMLRDSNRTGPTLYLGTRRSNWFGRLYDKAVESKLDHYIGHARAEAQFNKRGAKSAAAMLYRAIPEEAVGASLVSNLFASRGISRLWPATAGLQLYCRRKRTDADRRLQWISTQVAPSVKLLIERGRLKEVLTALGLDHEVVTVRKK